MDKSYIFFHILQKYAFAGTSALELLRYAFQSASRLYLLTDFFGALD